MNRPTQLQRQLFITAILLLLFTTLPIAAQDRSTAPVDAITKAPNSPIGSTSSEASKLERLDYIQSVLTQKIEERSKLGERIEAANEQDKAELRNQADILSNDIQQLRVTLETIATGGVDASLFVTEEAPVESDWRKDIALIAQPVIDSLKDLTEKPRKLAQLGETITQRQLEVATAEKALENLAPSIAQKPGGNLGDTLDRLAKLWESRRSDAQSAIEIARIQIAELQGDKALSETIFDALIGFVKGRGLTLVLALLAASIVWFGVRFLLRGYRTVVSSKTTADSRTRYRLAAYSVHALTFFLILIAVFVVFYERGDVLLLGLLILLIVGLALGIRNLLPRYISEARLLLNIGAMRESERVLYRGLPWRVESINMYTVLRNPELQGVLRIPLAEFHDVTSRPIGRDRWFPTSKGDVVLFPDQTLLEVIDQNPDNVELKMRGGQLISMPTTDFYAREMVNLTRGGSFGISNTFGIDYRHQSISMTRVPRLFREAVQQTLAKTDLADFIKDINVELKEANSSSIDYWVFVTCDSRAAKSYQRIKRTVQSACIETCTRESLNIPFPHIAVVQTNTG